MKQFKLYLVLIFSFFVIPFGVNAEITSYPFFNFESFQYFDNLSNDIASTSYNLVLYSVISEDNFEFRFGNTPSKFGDIFISKYVCSYSYGSYSCRTSNNMYNLFSNHYIFWSSSDNILGSTIDDYRFGDSILDISYYPFGNHEYLYTNSLKYESMFYRHFGYYDLSSIDDEAPVISLIGNNDIIIEINSIWNDPGYSCTDNVDTSCSVIVSSDLNISSLGDYTISYNATDSSGNVAYTVYRHIHVVDTIAPDISLIGDSVIHISLDSDYEELGVNVSDNSKEDIIPVIDSSSLDVSSVGTYTITYFACDSSDNCSSLKRIVKVQSVVPLDFSGSQYLLFDFSDIQDLFPKINFSGLSNSDEFIIVILFNIFFLIFIFIIIWIILKSVYKCISIIWG